MSTSEVFININDFDHGVSNVLAQFFLNYSPKYSLRRVRGGNTNILYLVSPNDAKYKKLLIRIYGKNTDIMIDRKKEEVLFQELSEIKFGPKLHGIFANGRIEEFYENAEMFKLHEQKYALKIAATLSEMHCLHPPSLQNKCDPGLWSIIDKWFNIASNATFKDNKLQQRYAKINWRNINHNIQSIKSLIFSSKLNTQHIAYDFMMESVFCHNDLFQGNILYLPKLDVIKFIDFEYSFYNHRAFDFANHFCEYGIKTRFPDKIHIKQFISQYIKYFKENGNCNKKVIEQYENDSFLEQCMEIVILFCIMSHFFWGLWSIVMGKYSDITHFDFMAFAYYRLRDGYNDTLTLLHDDIRTGLLPNLCNPSKL